ncbi:acetyltransferase [Pilimelia anulata]|uniref:Acetyltransferase n=1 Tax=Pilimelia anulata TaxID=53371 RepID=A0A8J3BDG0_9ACTN|nr:GNAT family N-acetyltransferase [Pilimelia anulata]GGK05877.1 acetyltransferase [Pilimelia anulata]
MGFGTARLRAREWADADAERAYDLYRRDEVSRWLGSPPAPLTSLAGARERVASYRQRNADSAHPCGVWALERRDTGLVVGTALLKVLPRSDGATGPDVEVGWHLHPDSWGSGYATEAGRALLDRAFAAGLPAVYAVVYADNAASIAVTRRLGMAPLGPTDRWYGVTLESFVARPPAGG